MNSHFLSQRWQRRHLAVEQITCVSDVQNRWSQPYDTGDSVPCQVGVILPVPDDSCRPAPSGQPRPVDTTDINRYPGMPFQFIIERTMCQIKIAVIAGTTVETQEVQMKDRVGIIECPDCGTLTLEVAPLTPDEKCRECAKWGQCTKCGQSFECVWHKSILVECNKR